jgi:SAM-dependent methyltransferase
MTSEYVLEVGRKGFDRLRFINDVFGEHSRAFLNRAGLREGQCVLELGCGVGSMTTWIAAQVGGSGRVIAVDASEKQLEIARAAAEKAGLANIDFVRSTVEALDLPRDSIDLAYCRLLLMHLSDPKRAISGVKNFLKSGGAIACEEPHASSLTTSPRNAHIEKLNGLFIELGKRQGLDFDIGDKLFSMLHGAGYSQLRGCNIQPIISMADAIEFVLMGAAEIAPVAIKSGLVTEADARQMLLDLQNMEYESDSHYTFPRQAQIVGCKQ